MKALITTSVSQGARDDDYMHCLPGELVWLPDMCDADQDSSRAGCGCRRGFGGLASHKATTTVEVVEVAMTEAELRRAFESSLRDQGWIPPDTPAELVEEILLDELDIIRAVQGLPVGTLVRRDGDNLRVYEMFATE